MSKSKRPTNRASAPRAPVATVLLPIVTTVFGVYLVIGMAMPVLPIHVHGTLRLGTFVVGLVAGGQFVTSLLSRIWAGYHSDTRGPKSAVVVGSVLAVVSGLLYLASVPIIQASAASVTVLLSGRAILGGAESFITMGALGWGLALVGGQHTGTVMSWVGIAIFAAYAVGAPAGTVLYARYGFISIGLVTVLVPLAMVAIVAPSRSVSPSTTVRPEFTKALGAVWFPGLGLALSSVGFCAITTFAVLLFAQRNWCAAWIALTAMSAAFMFARLVFGHLPDQIGGSKVALASILVEAAGLALISIAASPLVAFVGAGLTGLGYALVYPGFGVDAARHAQPEFRGLAMGAYTACLDLGLGIANPMLGLLASVAGLDAVFFASTVAVLSAAGVALVSLNTRGQAPPISSLSKI